MVSRIILSLRNAVYSQVYHDGWTVENLTTVETGELFSTPHHEMELRKRTAFSVNG